MNNKNVPWIVIGLLTIALFFVAKNKPIAIINQNLPTANRPFADDWTTSPVFPPAAPLLPVDPSEHPSTYAEVLAAAKRANKPILLFFTGKNCPPCQQMRREIGPSIASLNGQVFWHEVDAQIHLDLCRKFNVTATPTYLIINHQEQVLKFGSGYKNVRAFGEWLAAPYQNAPPTTPPLPQEPPPSGPDCPGCRP